MASRPPVARFRRLVSVALALAGAGCTSTSGGYPSLAPRPIEEVSLAEPASKPQPAATPQTDAARRYAPLIAKAREADAAFMRALDGARERLLRGRDAPVGSDAWGDAQQSYSRLAAYREPVVQAASELQSETETPETQGDAGLARAAADALARVKAIDAREAETMRTLAPRAS